MAKKPEAVLLKRLEPAMGPTKSPAHKLWPGVVVDESRFDLVQRVFQSFCGLELGHSRCFDLDLLTR
jgi:hypothetical protein